MINKLSLDTLLNSKVINKDAKVWLEANWDYFNKPMKLLTTNSTKTLKGFKKLEITTAILYLQPADKIAISTLCAAAELYGCKEPCLISSGQLGMSVAQNAATKRTILLLTQRESFDACLIEEISKYAKKFGKSFAVRLNGTSDIDFSSVIASLPSVTFYDYTKLIKRLETNKLPNYHLTYSGSAYSAYSRKQTVKAIRAKYNTVLAFNTKEAKGDFKLPNLPSYDDTDLRYLDTTKLGSLTRKGSNKAERAIDNDRDSFFFTPKTYGDLIAAVNI